MRAVALAAAIGASSAAWCEEPSAEAKAHFAAGALAYRAGDYARAAEEYEASFRLSGAALLLYDMGQAYRRLGDAARAVEAYRRYLAAAPEGKYRGAAEQWVGVLGGAGEASAAPAAPTVTEEIVPRPAQVKQRGEKRAIEAAARPWATAGLLLTGVAVLASGAGAGVLGQAVARDAAAGDAGFRGGWAAIALGGAALAAAVACFFVAGRRVAALTPAGIAF